jgi:hypothetical protein
VTDQPIETITAPDPANVRLDPRLMTAGRLVELAGYREVVFTPTESGLYIDCGECHRGITAARLTTGVQLMADVLRHYVNVHNVSLSGGRPT